MAQYHDDFEELCALYEKQVGDLHAACEEYKANPTPELYKRCTILGYSVSDTKWDLEKNYPGRMTAHHLSAVR